MAEVALALVLGLWGNTKTHAPIQNTNNVTINMPEGKVAHQAINSQEMAGYTKYVVAIAISAAYVKAFYEIKGHQDAIQAEDNISNWKSNLKFEAILKFDYAELRTDLLNEVKSKFGDDMEYSYNPEIFAKKMVQREIAQIKGYLNLCKWLKSLYLTAILPVDKKCKQLAKEKLVRLAFISKLINK